MGKEKAKTKKYSMIIWTAQVKWFCSDEKSNILKEQLKL
jgi:hypothetical protein